MSVNIRLSMVLLMSANSKWTAADVPDQTGRVAIITGSNTGLGYETALVLADRGARVVLAVRDTEKGQAAAARIVGTVPRADVAVQPLDLGSLQSVRTSAEELKAAYPRIDLLINNAGVMQTPKGTTKDGFELQFGTNHLGHFALTGLLLENLLPVEGSRVVTISSQAHRVLAKINFDDLQSERSYNRFAAYGQSKLANLLFTYELARRLDGKGTIAVAAHPGGSSTELTRNWPALVRPIGEFVWGLVTQPPDMGALPTLRAATDPAVRNAQYYGPDGIGEQHGNPKLVESNARSHDKDIQGRLWTVSEELTGVSYPV
jgi:NAD(P)-dependent dehydrogenase (short-subunit alcohol dehydrogenase family)